MITNTKINRTKASGTRRQLKQSIIFCFICIITPLSIFSQEEETYWETTTPKGENPWANEETKETQETINPTETPNSNKFDTTVVVIANGEELATEEIVSPNTSESPKTDETATAASKSTATIRHFKFDHGEIVLNSNNRHYIRSLKYQGSQLHKGNGSLAGGIITGSFVSFFAFPVNMIASVIPTTQINNKIEKFKSDNPHATAEEVSAIRRGITNNRFTKAVLGNLIGMGINITAIIVLAFM